MKPIFEIDISKNGKTPLEAFHILSELDPNIGFHKANNLRPPLGIYNTSISRILDKLTKCSEKLEQLFNSSKDIKKLREEDKLHNELIDYIELSLYAAAEHIDDITQIAKGFFADTTIYKSLPATKELEKIIKKQKTLISASINAIKHQQARIRLFSLEIKHGDEPHCLHGYFIEGVHNGEIGPNKIFHDKDREVFSITSLMWEIICFLLNASRALKSFLQTVVTVQPNEDITNNKLFSQTITTIARLPIYSFDDKDPFSETTVKILSSDPDIIKLLDSKIYGAFIDRWSDSNEMSFGGSLCSYVGDGVSKSFKMVKPTKVSLLHWI